MNPILPKGVNSILSKLEEAGYSAYAVGGCVRDILRSVTPDDYDITTSASPDEMLNLFGEDAIPTGLKHGTVTVKSNGIKCEVTTYRAEGTYTDHRRPDEVHFVSDVSEDLSRRDFTMNAIALSRSGEYIDLFGGINDIQNSIIRCVGNAETRFNEDALRMFRALRFSAVLGFEIEEATLAAVKKCAPLARHIAAERIAVEFQKAVLGKNMRPLEQMFSLGLLNHFLNAPAAPDFSALTSLPSDITLRLSAMCFMLQSGGNVDTPDFLKSLRMSNETVKICSGGVSAALNQPQTRIDWKRIISEIGFRGARCAAASLITESPDSLKTIYEIESSGECCSINALAITGNDIISLGVSGPDVGDYLRKALSYVIKNPQSNTKSELIAILKGM